MNTVNQEIVFAVGDEVFLVEKKISSGDVPTAAKIVEIRHILGKQTYVIETSEGKRKVVGASQLTLADK